MLNLSLLFATSTDKVLLAKGVAMSFLAGYIGITATWVLLGVASLVLLALVSYVAVIYTMKAFESAWPHLQNTMTSANNCFNEKPLAANELSYVLTHEVVASLLDDAFEDYSLDEDYFSDDKDDSRTICI